MAVTSRKEREKEQRREAILEAARRVFLARGYQATTMEAVAAEAEFSKGTLYLYFHSKFELFAELSNQVLSRVEEGFQTISESDLQGREMIQAMLTLWVQVASSNIRQFRLAIGWIASDDYSDHDPECPGVAAHRARVAMVVRYLSSALQRGQKDGSIQCTHESTLLACQLWSGMMGALLFSSRCEDLGDATPFDFESASFMSGFVSLLCAGIGVAS